MALVHTALAEVRTLYNITSKSVFDYIHLQRHVHVGDLNITIQHYKPSLIPEYIILWFVAFNFKN